MGKKQSTHKKTPSNIPVERIQTGILLEKRMVKVLKALAEFHDISLGNLIEGIVLHAFEGKCALGPHSLELVREFKKLYQLELKASESHQLVDAKDA